MKHFLVIVLLTIATTVQVSAQTLKPTTGITELKLKALEQQMSDALVKADAATLDTLWSEDLVFTFPNGKVSNKAQRLAGLKPSTQPSPEMSNTNDEVKVYLYGDTAVVTVLSTWKGKANDQEFSERYQATHVWMNEKGRWRLVAAHVSQIKK